MNKRVIKSLRNIFTIYKNDWIRIFRTPVALFLIVALMILPSLYAWFNLKASWDPYSNTSGIKIAITNVDEGAVIRDKEVHIGDEIVSTLKKNDKLGWTFVSKKDADEGVKKGTYYASLYIPKDFSEKIGTVLEDEQVKPEIEYTVNEKLNAIAPKMTSSGASTIVQSVKESFVETVSESVLTIFNDAGIKLEEELPTIRNIESKIFTLEGDIPQIDALSEKILNLEEKIPEIDKQAQKLLSLEAAIPELNAASENILLLEEKLPELKKVGEGILLLQEKAPEIEQVALKVTELETHFSEISDTVAKAVANVEKMQDFITTASGSLEEIEQGINNGQQIAEVFPDFMEKNKEAFDTIGPVYKQNLLLYQNTADAVHQYATLVKNGTLSNQEITEKASVLETQVQTSIDSLNRSITLFTTLNTTTNNGQASLQQEITDLQTLQTNFKKEKELLGNIPVNKEATELMTLSQEAINLSSTMLNRYDTQTAPGINNALDALKDAAQNAGEDLKTAQENLPKLKEILGTTKDSLTLAQDNLATLQNNLPTIEEEIQEASSIIQDNIDDVLKGIDKAADFYTDTFPSLEEKVHRAADFVRNDLPEAEKQLSKVASIIRNDLPGLEESVHKVAGLVRDELPSLKKSLISTADSIRDFEDNYDLGEIISLLKNDINEESDFMANPVVLDEHSLFPIPNYGSANSPFYTTLSLWVGGLLLISLLRVDVRDPEGIYTSNQIYFGRGLTFLTIGFFQSLIVTLGDIFILKAYVADPVAFILFSMLISMVFMTIVYTLVSVFGNIGKGVAIIFLVLQLSGAGGTFPIQVAPPFFQAINPFLPFTYAINLLRETVGGMVNETVYHAVSMLLLFGAIAIITAIFLKKPLANATKKTAEKARSSEIIH